MPAKKESTSRVNQRRRTRKDLLAAAARLLRGGRTPDMDDIAAEAMVSRATAYRYFPTLESLLAEAPLDGMIPTPDLVFPNDDLSADPVERADRAEAALHKACLLHEVTLRRMLAANLVRTTGMADRDNVPRRQNRRIPLIAAALAPARRRFSRAAYERLCAALAMVYGPESMIVFQDVLGLNEQAARKVKSWTVRTLVSAALSEARQKKSRQAGTGAAG